MSDPRANMAGMAAQFNENNSDNMNVANFHGMRLCDIPGGANNPALMGQPTPKKRATTKQNQTASSAVTVVNDTAVQNYQQQQPTGGMQFDPATGAGAMSPLAYFQQFYALGTGTPQVPQQQSMMMRSPAPGMMNFANMGHVNGAHTQTPMSNVQAPAQSPMQAHIQTPGMVNSRPTFVRNAQATANGARVQAPMMSAQTSFMGHAQVPVQTHMQASIQAHMQTLGMTKARVPVARNAQAPANSSRAQTPMSNAQTPSMGHAQVPVARNTQTPARNPQGVQQQSQGPHPAAPSFIPAQNGMAPQQARVPQDNMQQRVAQPDNKTRNLTPAQSEAIQKQMEMLQSVEANHRLQQEAQDPLNRAHPSTEQPAKQTPESGAMSAQKNDEQMSLDFQAKNDFCNKVRETLVKMGAPAPTQKQKMLNMLQVHGIVAAPDQRPVNQQMKESFMQRLQNGRQPGELPQLPQLDFQQFNARQNFVAQQPAATPLFNDVQPKAGKQTNKAQPKTPKPKAKKPTKKELAEQAERAALDPSDPDYEPLPPSRRPLVRVEPDTFDKNGMPVTPEADVHNVYYTPQPNELSEEEINRFVQIVRDENAGKIPKAPSDSVTSKKKRTTKATSKATSKAAPKTASKAAGAAKPVAIATPPAVQQAPSNDFTTQPTPQSVSANGFTYPAPQAVATNGFTQPIPQAVPANGFTQPAGNVYQTNDASFEDFYGADSYLTPPEQSPVNDFTPQYDDLASQTFDDFFETSTGAVDPNLLPGGVPQDVDQVNGASVQPSSGTPTGYTGDDLMSDFSMLQPLAEATRSASPEGASAPQIGVDDGEDFLDKIFEDTIYDGQATQAIIDAINAGFAKENNTSSQALPQQDSLQPEHAVQPGQMRKVSNELRRVSRETASESVTVADETPVAVSTPVAANAPATASTPATVSAPAAANTSGNNGLIYLASLIRPGMSQEEIVSVLQQVSTDSYSRGTRDASQLAASQSAENQPDGVSNQVQDDSKHFVSDNNACAQFDSSPSCTPSPDQVSSVFDTSPGNGFSSSLPSSPEANASVTESSLVNDQSAVTKPSSVTDSASITGLSTDNFASSGLSDSASTKFTADNTLDGTEIFTQAAIAVNMADRVGFGDYDGFTVSPLMNTLSGPERYVRPSDLEFLTSEFEQPQPPTPLYSPRVDPAWQPHDPNFNLFSVDHDPFKYYKESNDEIDESSNDTTDNIQPSTGANKRKADDETENTNAKPAKKARTDNSAFVSQFALPQCEVRYGPTEGDLLADALQREITEEEHAVNKICNEELMSTEQMMEEWEKYDSPE
ncbi:hypothetical protein NW762_003482 [Fusarium torreyae]|uniref:Uncharacterized protein n=1 Tax=Fusarium torreyae TaxID=1237075 RepID=A0A9W8SAU7_9HYPO|nr:hypothetical protein NW762_003482 [Fusarium torreyae]